MIPSLWPQTPDFKDQLSEDKRPRNITIKPGISDIDYPTAQLLIETGKVKLVDVRERDEFKEGFIIGAINMPIDSINEANTLLELPDKNMPVILYCLSGKRSYEAALKLRQMGYNYLINMGGISHWPYGTVRI